MPTMLTVKEVSKRLKISLALVYREVRAGRLAAHCFGRRTYRIAEADLTEYLDQSRRRPDEVASTSCDSGADSAKPTLRAFRHIKVNRLLS
jgi:excisionase family DNA binding protein